MAVITSVSARRGVRSTDWRAGIFAGILGGVASDLILTGGMMLQGDTPWVPAHLISAMVFGFDALPPPSDFEPGLVAVASLIHFALAIGYGLIGAWLFDRLSYRTAALAGAVYGLALYVVNYYLIAPILFPWLSELRGIVGIVTHLTFGTVMGLAIVRLRNRARRR
jgi:hypothetical protein